MVQEKDAIHIIGADRVGGGLLVYFSDQSSTLFRDQFLYDARNSNGNLPIVDENMEGSEIADYEEGS